MVRSNKEIHDSYRVADVDQDQESVKILIASHVKSQYPINVVSMSEGPEERHISALVAAYKELELDDAVPAQRS